MTAEKLLNSSNKTITSSSSTTTTATKSLLSITTAKPKKSSSLTKSKQKAMKKAILGPKKPKVQHKRSKNTDLKAKSAKQLIDNSSKPTIKFANGLSAQQRDKTVEIVMDILETTNTSQDSADCIRQELEKELGLRSNVILSSTPFMEQSFINNPGSVAMQLAVNGLNNNDVLISLFGQMGRSSGSSSSSSIGSIISNEFTERSNNLMKTAQKLSPKIIDSLMSTDMKQEIQKLSTRVVRNAKTIHELSDQLSEVINDKFGPHWHTVVGHKQMMSVDNHRKTSVFYINMDFGDLRVSVFK
ncbi:uncharacterized protein LOC128961207 [Oppia nitens]|uniref:uncharacterized protein LOC128961207 n=1 Tax=Oppia nitens TaxID=1686743 RepID=UPI0023D9C4E5|nr:uncharacterized protein LOC128961207 [Oppia nitens]